MAGGETIAMDETRVELTRLLQQWSETVEFTTDELYLFTEALVGAVRAHLARPTDPGEDKVEAVARAIAREILEQDGHDNFNLKDDLKIEWLDQGEVDFARVARAAIAAMGHTPPSGEDGELRELLIESFDFLRGVDDAADLRKRVLTALQGIGGR
jgi:hypothetical protein